MIQKLEILLTLGFVFYLAYLIDNHKLVWIYYPAYGIGIIP